MSGVTVSVAGRDPGDYYGASALLTTRSPEARSAATVRGEAGYTAVPTFTK